MAAVSRHGDSDMRVYLCGTSALQAWRSGGLPLNRRIHPGQAAVRAATYREFPDKIKPLSRENGACLVASRNVVQEPGWRGEGLRPPRDNRTRSGGAAPTVGHILSLLPDLLKRLADDPLRRLARRPLIAGMQKPYILRHAGARERKNRVSCDTMRVGGDHSKRKAKTVLLATRWCVPIIRVGGQEPCVLQRGGVPRPTTRLECKNRISCDTARGGHGQVHIGV